MCRQLLGAVDANNHYDCFINITHNVERINNQVLTDVLNEFFVLVASDYSPFDLKFFPNLFGKFDHDPDNLIISEFSVYNALKHLNVNHSSCDDILSNRLLTDLTEVSALSSTYLCNN